MAEVECPHTWEDVETCKDITLDLVRRDYHNLCVFDATVNSKKLCGNKTLYYYQYRNLIRCRRETWHSLETIMNNPVLKQDLWNQTVKRNRNDSNPSCSTADMFECWRINKGAIVFFKSTTSKYLYRLFNATSVLDPCAGWGGRMLGAMAHGIKYTGIDTNINLKEGYDRMINDLLVETHSPEFVNQYKMIWDSCLNVNYNELDYDFILTSPPYINMEVYENMTPFESDIIFYTDFLIPMMNRSFEGMNVGGHMCINISPKMFKSLMKIGYRPPDSQVDLRQSMGQNYATKSQDYIYVWNK
tara:strand:- start:244 stop:1146 length:903 start_codon:yes stop_codon:yes gene_type:complete